MARTTELTVTLENRPGTLADVAEALGAAGVNIDGMHGMDCQGQGIVSMVVSDTAAAARALDAAGVAYTQREVLLVTLEDKPGVLGRVARAMANAGVNLDGAYLTMGGKVVLGSDNLAGAEGVARSQGLM